jgi:hypothetical protein
MEFFPFWPPEGEHPCFEEGVEPSPQQSRMGEPIIKGIDERRDLEFNNPESADRQSV